MISSVSPLLVFSAGAVSFASVGGVTVTVSFCPGATTVPLSSVIITLVSLSAGIVPFGNGVIGSGSGKVLFTTGGCVWLASGSV